jgi:AraC-like DNA-binding protein
MPATERSDANTDRLMWLTPRRVFYAGLLGAAGERCLGGHGVYLSPAGRANRIRIGGGAWQSGALLVVPPQVPHRVESSEPLIFNLLIEAESVDPAALPGFLQHCGPVDAPDVVRAVRAAHARLLSASGQRENFDGLDFDTLFFGQALAARPLDARVRRVIDRIVADPAAAGSAEQCAAAVHLSFSRFLHLFKQETGVSFRAFRAWKRARSLLRHVREAASLTDIALGAGYPDSTHFSHSIRQVYGLTPSDIVAGSRRLALHDAMHSMADSARPACAAGQLH